MKIFKKETGVQREVQKECSYFLLHSLMGVLIFICLFMQFKQGVGEGVLTWLKISVLPLGLAYLVSLYRTKDYGIFPEGRVNRLKFFWVFIVFLLIILVETSFVENLDKILSGARGLDGVGLVYLKDLIFYINLILFLYVGSGLTLALSSPLTVDERGNFTIHPAYKKDA